MSIPVMFQHKETGEIFTNPEHYNPETCWEIEVIDDLDTTESYSAYTLIGVLVNDIQELRNRIKQLEEKQKQ